MEAQEGHPEVDLAQALVQHTARHLREPEVHATVGGEHDGAKQGVVEVSNNEVGVRDVEVQRRGGHHDAGQATEQEGHHETEGENHGGFPCEVSAPHRAKPVEELHAGGNRNQERHEGEERQQDSAGDEHVVRPHCHRQRSDGQGCKHQARVAEHWFTGEHGDDLRHNAEERQSQDVHLGVPEEPEQVLPQDGTTVSGVVNVATQLAVVQHSQSGGGEHREDQQRQDRGNKDVPGEDRQAEHGHARRAQAQDGRDHVDGGDDGTDTTDTHAENPHVRANAWGVDGVRERRVHGPAEVSGTTRGEEARQHQNATHCGEPEAKCVQSGEGNVGCADLQRHDVVSKAPHHGSAVKQQHHGAVHGK